MTKNADALRRAVVSAPLDVDPFEPPSSLGMLEVAAVSVGGRLRAVNTDHYLALKITRGLETLVTSLAEADRPPTFEEHAYGLLVADGIGSQGAGARASRMALSALAHLAIQYGKWNVRVDEEAAAAIRERLRQFYRLADHALGRSSHKFPGTGLMTSLTMVMVAGADAFFGSVGQSKAFLFREGDLIQLTSDCTLLERARPGSHQPDPPDDARQDLDSLITKGIGGRPGDADVEIKRVKVVSNDRLLLCTNGLTDVVSEAEIADGLALRRRPTEDCQHLVDLAVLAGGFDNVTAMVADYRTSHAEDRRQPDHKETPAVVFKE